MNQARRENGRVNAASAPRILVVEDETDLAVLLSYNLDAEGYVVESVERGDDVHVGRLRKALSRGRERDPIRTVRGTGYAFDETFGKA